MRRGSILPGSGLPGNFFKKHLDFIRQPAIMQICGCSSSVEYKLPKLGRWVRFPSAASEGVPVKGTPFFMADLFE